MTLNYEYSPGEGIDVSSAKMNKRAARMIEAFQSRHYQSIGHKILSATNQQ